MKNNEVEIITSGLLDELIKKAGRSERKRVMYLFHQGDWEHAHRMLNTLIADTYVRPHMHSNKYQAEGFIILRGKVAVLIFSKDGNVDIQNSAILKPGTEKVGIDIKPGVWHTAVALEDSVVYEVKGQPNEGYRQEESKNFASWAPGEGTDEAKEYLETLKEIIFKTIPDP